MPRTIMRRTFLGGAVVSATALTFSARAEQAAKVHEVTIKRFTYEPEQIEVRVGDIIRWTNLDIAPHTASADDLSWDTKELKRNESAEITVEDGMVLTYFCAFHPHMKGTVRVV